MISCSDQSGKNKKIVKVKVAQNCPTLCDPMDYTVHGILKARILKWIAFSFSGGSSQPRDQTEVSRIAGRLYTSWATKGSPSTLKWEAYLLQRIFPTQGSNRSLLHCRQILYQLSYQGSLKKINRKQIKTDHNSLEESFLLKMTSSYLT